MSTPENPLSQYYTYSYHHILIACDTTEVAEAIQTSNKFVTFTRSPDQRNTPENPFGKYSTIPFQNKGNYCIIVNGMTDAEFVIRDASWSSVTAASCGLNGVDRFTSMALEGSLTIDEPRGVKFMNVMSYVADQLQSDPSGIIFVLKTIFVGHVAPGLAFSDPTSDRVGDVYDPITNIRPVLFIMYDITGEFTTQGGTYHVSWVGINNGASKQKHIMRATDRVKINMGTGPTVKTLHGALQKLAEQIRLRYDDYYQSTVKQLKADGLETFGRRVEYVIDTEYPYSNADGSANGDYIVTDFKQQNTDSGETADAGILDLGTSASVESAIMQVVNRCPKVKEDAVYKDSTTTGEKVRYVPKVVSTIESTSDVFRVVYKLRRMQEGRNDIIEKVQKRSSDNTNTLDADVRNNLLTLDYFFTGKNVDILDFDIKMEMGLVFFQTLVSTDTLQTSEEAKDGIPTIQQGSNDAQGGGPKVDSTKRQGIRPNTPIFFSTKFDDKMTKNTTNPRLANDFQALLNRHAALENLEANVTIHGNPGLLNATNKQPSEVIQRRGATDTPAADINRDVFPYWETTPALVKLNIRMPADDEDKDYSQPFWYEGYYYCFGITHRFSGGEFTQELDMISLPQSPKETTQTQQVSSKTSGAQQQASKQRAENKTAATGNVGSTNTTQTTSTNKTSSNIPAEDPQNIRAKSYLDAYFKGQNTPNC